MERYYRHRYVASFLAFALELSRERGRPEVPSAPPEAAKLLGVADRRGSLRPGAAVDLIAVRGNPRSDIRALREVVFVMHGIEATLIDVRFLDLIQTNSAKQDNLCIAANQGFAGQTWFWGSRLDRVQH